MGIPYPKLRLHSYLLPEKEAVQVLTSYLKDGVAIEKQTEKFATRLVNLVRKNSGKILSLDKILATYNLSSKEGVALMSLAESLFRTPDKVVQNELIKDKIGGKAWQKFLSHKNSLLANIVSIGMTAASGAIYPKGLKKLSMPIIREAMLQSMKFLDSQFVMSSTIKKALNKTKNRYSYSFDMLGEGARTKLDADSHFDSYFHSIKAIVEGGAQKMAGISVKLSAIYPRYEYSKTEEVNRFLVPKIIELAIACSEHGVFMVIDAEETERLELSLRVIERVLAEDKLKGWQGLGLAVQAYQKRGFYLIDYICGLAKKYDTRITVRLVKGAYWDSEIKKAQELGVGEYPVFTRKSHTDISYMACAKKIMKNKKYLYPKFATHNAHTVAFIKELAEHEGVSYSEFEFQKLFGMGDDLYDALLKEEKEIKCCVYAPVGEHKSLLPYLVRRLLENGANGSFVHKIRNTKISTKDLVESPLSKIKKEKGGLIQLAKDIYAPTRVNSFGENLADRRVLKELEKRVGKFKDKQYKASSIIDGKEYHKATKEIRNPALNKDVVGSYDQASKDQICKALDVAYKFGADWATPEARAGILVKASKVFEDNREEFLSLLIREGGKTIPDAIAEIREAVDFCRYYAVKVRDDFVSPTKLKGYTGESNELSYHGRGVFVCVAPWNFPMAIFTGQVAAALAAGNSVVAKPAELTPVIANLVVKCLYEAGVPKKALSLLICKGSDLGKYLLSDDRVAGVAFTGSTQTAHTINRSLANRDSSLATLIAETGGLNAMIVDSSTLIEQAVDDIIVSAFHSAGQRCSALRVVYVQEDIADELIKMLKGAMQELKIGDPSDISIDVGPVIDGKAKKLLASYVSELRKRSKVICELKVDDSEGSFFGPCAYELKSGVGIKEEVFGPILHVVRFKSKDLDGVIDEINSKGFGLTMGIHTRIENKAKHIASKIKAGNIYVNRTTIGAVVGVQPFGGEGLSGTGPKAGGPSYLKKFTTERVVTTDTTATAGNIELYTLDV